MTPPIKISFSLRAFVFYFAILATLSWFILDEAIERLNVALRKSAESVLVDTANLLATSLEQQLSDGSLDTWEIERLFDAVYQRKLQAQIYQVLKEKVDTEVYVTDGQGKVVYDSTGLNTGEDFSEWRDVRLTLDGEYGARTSFRYADQTEEDDEKIMVISAPIHLDSEIVGVVGVVKPIEILEMFLLADSNQLKRYAIGLLALAMILGYLVSHSFTASTNRLANFANDIAAGKKVRRPEFMDKRFSNLSKAIAHLRQQLDGKEYVEQYVHSLTHELKTPVTAIQGSTELLREDLPEEERNRFLQNIETSNSRMARLVDRMLSLAKIEGLPEVTESKVLNLSEIVDQLVSERQTQLQERNLAVRQKQTGEGEVMGDPLLISQAIANLLDNAMDFSSPDSQIEIMLETTNRDCQVSVCNKGPRLDEFALNKAFERFFSLPGPFRATKSTGLGLSFVHEIMSLHQGNASIQNTQEGVMAKIWWPNGTTA
ncbi:MAG: two-component system sensor histidine kinase CreC [Acidiferrobacterales bacterium]|nr:two-component system sensor histidine kinase CreC [Acidiferrobacterales bacterium]